VLPFSPFSFSLSINLQVQSRASILERYDTCDSNLTRIEWNRFLSTLHRCQCIHYLCSHCYYFRLNGSVADGNAFNPPATIVRNRFHSRFSISSEMLPFHSVQFAQLTALEKRCLRFDFILDPKIYLFLCTERYFNACLYYIAGTASAWREPHINRSWI